MIRIPQARILRVLMPSDTTSNQIEWPILTRAALGVGAGYTAISGTITRALNGIKNGSSSGDPHPGLIKLGLVEVVALNIEGTIEINYRATANGIREYMEYISTKGNRLPTVRPAGLCTNDRYSRPSS